MQTGRLAMGNNSSRDAFFFPFLKMLTWTRKLDLLFYFM